MNQKFFISIHTINHKFLKKNEKNPCRRGRFRPPAATLPSAGPPPSRAHGRLSRCRLPSSQATATPLRHAALHAAAQAAARRARPPPAYAPPMKEGKRRKEIS